MKPPRESPKSCRDELRGREWASPGEVDSRSWLERLIAACDRVLAEDVRDPQDPYLRTVLDDTAALRAHLQVELDRERGKGA